MFCVVVGVGKGRMPMDRCLRNMPKARPLTFRGTGNVPFILVAYVGREPSEEEVREAIVEDAFAGRPSFHGMEEDYE